METLTYYRHNLKEPFRAITPSVINYHEITTVFEGVLNYEINGESVSVKAGDVIYVKNGSVRARKVVEGANYISVNFLSEKSYDFPLLIENGLTEIWQSLLMATDGIYQYTQDLSDERFTLLLKCIIKQLQTQIYTEKESPLVKEIKRYIKANLSKKITLEEVCAQVYLSPAYCESVFKKETGETVIDYAINEKMIRAKALLTEGASSLIEISEELGFSDYNYFSRLFKKRVGISPLQFKRNYCKQIKI